jgi:RNA-binding protein Tab2/Atab2
MTIWQADISSRPQQNDRGETLWELVICDADGGWFHTTICPQKQVNAEWIATQIKLAATAELPRSIEVFRPQSLGLIQTASAKLGIEVVATRRTIALKKLLQQQGQNYHNAIINHSRSSRLHHYRFPII